jgi:hypothetical protein
MKGLLLGAAFRGVCAGRARPNWSPNRFAQWKLEVHACRPHDLETERLHC